MKIHEEQDGIRPLIKVLLPGPHTTHEHIAGAPDTSTGPRCRHTHERTQPPTDHRALSLGPVRRIM